MADTVKNKDIYELDLFKNLIENGKDAIVVLDAVEQQFKDILKASEAVLKLKPKTAKDFEKLSEAVNKVKTTTKGLDEVSKQRLRLEKELKKANSDSIQKNVELNEQLKIQRKRNIELAKEKLGLISAYAKESKRLADLRIKYKNVALTQGESSNAAIRLQKEITKLDSKLKRIDASAGQFQRNVGNYKKGLTSLANILSAGGITLGVTGFFRVVRNGIGIIKDFDQANANLAAILKTNREGISELTDSAVRFGSETEFTASQVTSLQEAYARLGFTQKEILGVTEATLAGASALRSGLGETATLTGGVLRSFNKDVSDSKDVIDALTESTTSSALDFQKLNVALPIVGTTAKNAGDDLTPLLAKLSVLSDRNIDASTSATGLRNIYLELSKKGLTYEEALDKIANATDKNKVANELFGKRSATVAVILSQSRDKVNELTKAYDESGGAAERVAKEQLDTLEGSVKLLGSAYEGAILKVNEFTNTSAGLKDVIKFLANNLETLFKIILTGVTAFVSYKAAIISVNLATKAYAAAQKGAAFFTALFTKRTKQATTATKLFNKATKANVIGAIVSLLLSAVSAFALFKDGAEDAADAQRELNEAQQEGLDLQRNVEAIEKRVSRIDSLNKKQLKNLLQSIDSEIDANEKKGAKLIENESATNSELEKRKESFNKRIEEIDKELTDGRDQLRELELRGERQLLQDQLDDFSGYKGAIEEANDGITKSEIEENRKRLEDFRATTLKRLAIVKNAAIEEGDADVSARRIAAKKIEKIGRERTAEEIERDKKLEEARERFFKEGLKQYEKGEQDRLDVLKREEEKKAELIKNSIEVLSSLFEKQSEARINAIDKEISAEEKRISQLEAIANSEQEGAAEAAQTLASEQLRLAELQQKKIREQKKQQQQELVFTAIELYGQKVANGDKNALGSTISDITLLKSFIASLPSFFVGSDDIGRASDGLDSNGGRLIVAHDNEQIWSKSDRGDVGFRSRDEIKDIVSMHDNNLVDISKYNTLEPSVIKPEISRDTKILKDIKTGIDNLPKLMPDHEVYWNQLTGIITKATKDYRGVHRVHKRFES